MEILQSLKGSLAWFGGSLAGLTALCYGAGYFLFHAHLTMLGLNGIVDLPHEQMLLEGSRFFLLIASILIQEGLVVSVLAIVGLISAALLRRIGPVAEFELRCRNWMAPGPGGPTGRRRKLALLAVLLIVSVHFGFYFDPLNDLGSIHRLLFQPSALTYCVRLVPHDGVTWGSAAGALISGGGGATCRAPLLAQFEFILTGYLLLLGIVALAFSKWGAALGSGPMAKVALGAYAIIFTLSLPLGFGVLVREPIYPDVTVGLAGGGGVRGRLLERSDRGVLLWFGGPREAVWYSGAKIETITVTGVSNLFDPEATGKS